MVESLVFSWQLVFCQDTFTTSEGKAAFTTLVHTDFDDENQESCTATLRNGFHGESI